MLCLSRQALPAFRDAAADVNLVALGAYVVVEPEDGRDVTLIATGSEVSIALEAAQLLAQERHPRRGGLGAVLRSVSPAIARISRPPCSGRAPRVGVEAAVEGDWARWLGDDGEFVGMTGFGASAPAEVLYREFGITAEAVADGGAAMPRAIRMATTHA